MQLVLIASLFAIPVLLALLRRERVPSEMSGGDAAASTIGFVTSSGPAPGAGGSHALALIEGGLSRMGEVVKTFHLGAIRQARIAPACLFDPAGERLDG